MGSAVPALSGSHKASTAAHDGGARDDWRQTQLKGPRHDLGSLSSATPIHPFSFARYSNIMHNMPPSDDATLREQSTVMISVSSSVSSHLSQRHMARAHCQIQSLRQALRGLSDELGVEPLSATKLKIDSFDLECSRSQPAHATTLDVRYKRSAVRSFLIDCKM